MATVNAAFMSSSAAPAGKERRHAFRSFKERVDSMKIEPSKKLNARAHDYVESSHFLATLEHWKEVNLSGDFSEFLYEVEPICQTLAQILHHQEQIYNSLHRHIQKNDVNSIQPLLELASQFIHDLGPDFMPYYKRFLNLIVEISQRTNPNDSQNMRNTSNVLEWCFNSLAFAFKYLSRTLTDDLRPTFTELLPVLEMTKQTYVSRFCAEALSFLAKKAKPDVLRDLVQFSFNEQRDLLAENRCYRESLVVLYSESMKNTQETLHSKALVLFSVLLENAFSPGSTSDVCISAMCDILLVIIKHGSQQACAKFYDSCMEHLVSVIASSDSAERFDSVVQILITMCFAESGRKISSWESVFAVIDTLLTKTKTFVGNVDSFPPELMASLAHLFALIVRNCNASELARHFDYMISFCASAENANFFLSFYELAYTTAQSKMSTFGAYRTLQSVVSHATTRDQLMVVSHAIMKWHSVSPEAISELVIPSFAGNLLLEMISKNIANRSSEDVLLDLYWKLKLLVFCPQGSVENSTLMDLLLALKSAKPVVCPLFQDVVGLALHSAIQLSNLNSASISQLYEILFSFLKQCRCSVEFMMACIKLIERASSMLEPLLTRDEEQFHTILAGNFSLSNVKIRQCTAELLTKLCTSTDKHTSLVLSHITIIDQISLEIANANDIKMRIRLFASEFAAQELKSHVDKEHIANFIIGLLTNNFQPCWLAVYETLPRFADSSCTDHLWRILMEFIQFNYGEQIQYCLDDERFGAGNMEQTVAKFDVLNQKLAGNLALASATFFYEDASVMSAIFNHAKSHSASSNYKPMLRSRVIQALRSIPRVAEAHGAQFVEYAIQIHHASFEDDIDGETHSGISAKDRLALYGVCSGFKRLAKVPRNEELFSILQENLSSKQTTIQRESLEILFAWNKQPINKYRDNLKNLLDDKLFRDELQSLANSTTNTKIEHGDEEVIIPLVLRILYGRAKGASSNKSKNGRKFAIATVLPNLAEAYIEQFILMISEKLDYTSFFESSVLPEASKRDLRNMVGYLNMLYEVYNGLGHKFTMALRKTIKPLIFTLLSAQQSIESPTEDELVTKIAKTVRSLGFKCLDFLFKLTASTYDWNEEASLIFNSVVQPRLVNFSQENAQQPSALMKIILGWIESPQLYPFLYFNECEAVSAVMDLLGNAHAKESVWSVILDFCISALTKKGVEDERFYTVVALIVDGLLSNLPRFIENCEERDLNSKSATLLLLIIDGGYVKEQSTRQKLTVACAIAIKKPPAQIASNDRVSLLISLVSIIDGLDCSFEDLAELYQICSQAFRIYKDRNVRDALTKIFNIFGDKFGDYKIVAELLVDLNSHSERRMVEPDFERRLKAFRAINEDYYTSFTASQWLPLIYNCLFFINDPEELAIRSNASFTLTRFLDGVSSKTDGQVEQYTSLFYTVILPNLRSGLKKEEDVIREGYINVLSHVVKNSEYFPEFASMSVLLSENPETDFFKNYSHIQMTCRQKAIRDLVEVGPQISPECLYHYILPMTEPYTVCTDERLRNIVNDTHETWSHLTSYLRWDHFRQLFKKHIGAINKASEQEYRDQIHLVVRIAQGMLASFTSLKAETDDNHFVNLPSDPTESDNVIMREFFEPIMKIVKVRNDETITNRTLLVEAAVDCLLCVSSNIAQAAISGTLTSTCQALRSRTQHIRDAVRKTLCRVSRVVGPQYLKFIIKELKTALSRGAQIHVLSYTLHSILVASREDFKTGDLDQSAQLIVDVIMEDIFGAAGQEKDAEGYVSKMKEVKSKKSFDTGEILSSNISLPYFHFLVEPVKMLLQVNIPLKTKRKLDELLRRYSMGLNYNENASKRDILILCYELHQQSLDIKAKSQVPKKPTEAEEHFLVRIDAKPARMNVDQSQVLFALQRMCFELMRTALGRHSHLLTVQNLDGFIPLMQSSLTAEDESLLISLYKVLNLIVKLPFADTRDSFFTETATRAFTIIQNLSSTTGELAQICLRYLATIVRHKHAVKLNDSAMVYILVRLLPDLEEPSSQGLAFNFLKAVLSQHIVLPEVYDVMEKVSEIMVVNHNREIRDMSRSLYFQFLMEYEQGESKIEKSFKFLVNNLSYPTQAGRESVMELMHSIILRSSKALLDQLASSFFVGLASVSVSDDSSKCREMAAALIAQLLKKSSQARVGEMEDFCLLWMTQDKNPLLRRCGFAIYKIYLSVFGFGKNKKLDSIALQQITSILKLARNSDSDQENETSWEDVYTAMNTFSALCHTLKTDVLTENFEGIWKNIFETILYPHSWVRLLSSRLVGVLLGNLTELNFDLTNEQLQTISYRLLRQLSAPAISEDLGTQVVRNIIKMVTYWENNQTLYLNVSTKDKDAASIKENEETENEDEASKYKFATDYVVARACYFMRQENRNDDTNRAKKAAIQMAAVIASLVDKRRLPGVARDLVLSLYNLTEENIRSNEESEISGLARECIKSLEERLGTTEFSAIYTSAKQQIDQKRQERRVKRAQMAINAPDVAARRKLKKHERFREKRKHERDENGFYKPKRTKRS